MGVDRKFSCGIGSFGNVADRFVTGGYKEDVAVGDMIRLAKKIPQMGALEFVHNCHVTRKTAPSVKKMMDDAGLVTSIVLPDLWTVKKWGKGTLASVYSATRKDAAAEIQESLDVARMLGCDMVNVWLGQDGWEYTFCQDYVWAWETIAKTLREVAGRNPDMRVAIEYKIKEPRAHMHLGTIGKVLLMIAGTGCTNLGVVLDIGHAFCAYENPSQSIALLKMHGDRLFHTHFNDNYRLWDDDMIAGSIHTMEYLEFLYWMRRTEFKGWYSLDIFPYREDAVQAAQESIDWVNCLDRVIDRIGMEELGKVIARDDAYAALSTVRKAMFG